MYSEFTEKLLWGGKVVGVKVRLGSAEPAAVRALVSAAYEFRVQKDAGPKKARAAKQELKA